jgi:hypothetical protein
MIMMPDCWRWSSLQLKAQADFWHPAGSSPMENRRSLLDHAVQELQRGGEDADRAQHY